ncbi:MAG TPA: putative Ig domain-containing protein [Streptosporangiaceae bacterium]|nr:putative Ig domain-containing protein [Streptosporangiaceae bacterium]
MPGALASSGPLHTTTTSISGTQQLLVDPGVPPVLRVKVSVSAVGGSQAPLGNVVVSSNYPDTSTPYTCTASLASSSGPTATGSCEIRKLPFGSFQLKAAYRGWGNFAQSASGAYQTAVGVAPALTADSPALTATGGAVYRYTFAAKGVPAPTYQLASDAPGWLRLDTSTGQLSGRVPRGISSFTYSVIASNAVGKATAGPYTVWLNGHGGQHGKLVTQLFCSRSVVVGGGGSCTLVVLNRGNGPAAAVNAVIALPSPLRVRSCSHARNLGAGGCVVRNNAASWRIGTLNPGHRTSVSVFFSVRSPVIGRNWHSAKVTVQGIGLWGVQVWAGRQQSTFSYAHLTIYPR